MTSTRSTAASLHDLLSQAEEAATRCDSLELATYGKRITKLFEEASIKEFSEIELRELRDHVVRYRSLCSSLSDTLRAALTQASQNTTPRYAEGGETLVEPRGRFFFERYG